MNLKWEFAIDKAQLELDVVKVNRDAQDMLLNLLYGISYDFDVDHGTRCARKIGAVVG